MSISGQPVRLRTPLDFIVMAEHGKNMRTQCARNMSVTDPVFRQSPIGQLWAKVQAELLDAPGANAERILHGAHWPRSPKDLAITRTDFRQLVWEYVTANADRYNEPSRFTALIGYEYTPFTPAIHRVVIFRDGAAEANQVLPLDDALRPDLADIGYGNGVPMGGDLVRGPNGRSPRFLIRAVKDPDGANLDRVQVVKGWRDADGGVHERIFNVALSDGRRAYRDGSVDSVGSTVDVRDASYTNSIGDPELSVVWEDPDFDNVELAFYYVRVLEIPTPRWPAYDAKFYVAKLYSLATMPEVPVITQERAYSSPIWYTP